MIYRWRLRDRRTWTSQSDTNTPCSDRLDTSPMGPQPTNKTQRFPLFLSVQQSRYVFPPLTETFSFWGEQPAKQISRGESSVSRSYVVKGWKSTQREEKDGSSTRSKINKKSQRFTFHCFFLSTALKTLNKPHFLLHSLTHSPLN